MQTKLILLINTEINSFHSGIVRMCDDESVQYIQYTHLKRYY